MGTGNTKKKYSTRKERVFSVKVYLAMKGTRPISVKELVEYMRGEGLYAPTTYWRDCASGVEQILRHLRVEHRSGGT